MADEDNPRGYFELEAVKKGAADLSWVAQAREKAVKVVAPLVNALPPGHRYRVVFVERAVEDVLASQGKMIARRSADGTVGVEDTPGRRGRLRGEYQRILARTKKALFAAGLTVGRWCELGNSGAEALQAIRDKLSSAPPEWLTALEITRDADREYRIPVRTFLLLGRKLPED